MKKFGIAAIIIVIASLLLMTTQALANAPAVTANGTGNPHSTETASSVMPQAPGLQKTPGAKATEQAVKHGLKGKPTILHGTISAVDTASLTLTLSDGTSQTVGLTPETKIKVPGPQGDGDTLIVGMRAVAMARPDPNTSALVARMVIAIPGQPVRAHRVGTVTAYTPGSGITIQATDGNTYTFGLTTDTRLLPAGRAGELAVGSLVTIIAPRVPASLTWTAKGIVVHPAGQ